jgi:hypothetical protein
VNQLTGVIPDPIHRPEVGVGYTVTAIGAVMDNPIAGAAWIEWKDGKVVGSAGTGLLAAMLLMI